MLNAIRKLREDLGLLLDNIEGLDLPDNAVSLEHLDAEITPSHIVIAAGEFTTEGGDANERIVIASALATDLCHVTLHTVGSTPRTITTAVCGIGDIDVVMSGDPSTDHVLTYSVLRATS